MRSKVFVVFAVMLCALFFAGTSHASFIEQYAASVLGFSSELGSPNANYSANRALFASDVAGYGKSGNAWSVAKGHNDNAQYIMLGFTTAVYSTGTTIRENWLDGSVTKIELLDTNGVLHQVWNGTATSATGTVVNLTKTWEQTTYLVQGIKITVDATNGLPEIDSVLMRGSSTSVPLPPSVLLLLPGLAGMAFVHVRSTRNR